MKSKLTLLALAAAACLALGSSTAFGVTITDGFITIVDNGGGTGTNVLFDANQQGLTIGAGFNSNSTDFRATFSSTEPIRTSSGGAATLTGVDGGIRDLCFSLTDGATFTTLVLNLFAVNGQTGFVTFQVTYINPNGFFDTATFDLSGSGSNQFTITADNGALMTMVCWTSTIDVTDVRQYRIDGVAQGQQVPDGGATLIFLGVSLGAIGFVRRKLRKHSPAA